MERASPFLWNENILNTHYYGQHLNIQQFFWGSLPIRLVINSNLCRIACTVSEIGRLKGENRQFVSTAPSFSALARGDPFEFRDESDISIN